MSWDVIMNIKGPQGDQGDPGDVTSSGATGGELTIFDTATAVKAAADDASTPTNTTAPVGWLKIKVGGTDSWIPYYQ